MAKIVMAARTPRQKDIARVFEGMQGRHNLWQLWGDFVVMAACSISNAVDAGNRAEREKMYSNIASKYGKKEIDEFARILAMLVEAYEEDPGQDLLGELYMVLGLGNESGGQFFTPYSVCKCMAMLQFNITPQEIAEKGWVSVNDPAVGAGALLIAFAEICREKGINYQQHVLSVAQDIDMVTACMCYIQLSLLGCPGYVYVGDTLTDPCTAIDDRALIPARPEKCWFTPMYFHNTWHIRRLIERMRLMTRPIETKTAENDPIAPVTAQIEQEPEKIQSTVAVIPDENAETALLTDDNGQLMLF